ncbi:CrcB family protein, partial [Peribacillus cavernae]
YKRQKVNFPIGTWVINVSGSLLLGILAALHVSHSLAEWIWSMFGIGFCGAYTTFSTFGIETVTLIEAKNYKKAMIYVISSIVAGILAAATGYFLVINISL